MLVPRLTARIGFPPIGEAWRDTAVKLPESCTGGRDLFTGEALNFTGGTLPLARAFARLPFAVLCNSGFQRKTGVSPVETGRDARST